MRAPYLITLQLLLLLFVSSVAMAQMVSPTSAKNNNMKRLERSRSGWSTGKKDFPYRQALVPFYHGVASGDPLSDRDKSHATKK
ncbi:MAG: hypothetical protein AAGA66_02895 [Bacteroidota bacterium]